MNISNIAKQLESLCGQKSNHECDYVVSKLDDIDTTLITHYMITKITNDSYNTLVFWLDNAYSGALIFPKGSYLFGLENSNFCEIKKDWNEVVDNLFSSI